MANRTQLNVLNSSQETAIRANIANLMVAEIVRVYWPDTNEDGSPGAGTINYAWKPLLNDPIFSGVETFLDGKPLVVAFAAEDGVTEHHQLPLRSAFGDDTVTFRFGNEDQTFETLLNQYWLGVKVEVFKYIAELDIALSVWVGTLRAPEDADLDWVTVTADAGLGSPDTIIPNWFHDTGCAFYFAPTLAAAQRAGHPCDYDLDLGGTRGLNDPATGLPFTDCDFTRDGCFARMGDLLSYGGDDTTREATQIGAGQHTTTSTVEGNEGRLKNPVWVPMGKFRLQGCLPLATADEVHPDPKHKDSGTKRTLIEIGAGPLKSVANPELNGEVPQGQDIRRGTQGQSQTAFSPNVLSYNRRAVANLNKNPVNPKSILASQIQAAFDIEGQELVRIYSDPIIFAEGYTQLRAWLFLMMLLNDWWGAALDPDRVVIDDFLLLAGTGAKFNSVLQGATLPTVVADFCQPAGWLPFFYNGKLRVIPMESVDLNDADIPVITDGTIQADITATLPPRNVLFESTENGEKSRIKVRRLGSKKLPKIARVIWYDEANDYVERNTSFRDRKIELAAGRAYKDNSKDKTSQQVTAVGLTSFQEVVTFGSMVRDIGLNGEGGLLNDCEVEMVGDYFLPEFTNMHKGKVFRLLTKKLTPYKDKNGVSFQWFRCKALNLNERCELVVTAEAYGEIFWNSQCLPQSGYVAWDTPNAAVIDGDNGVNTLIATVSGSLGATGKTYSDSIDPADVVVYTWEHTVLELPPSGSYHIWNAAGQIGFQVWSDGSLIVFYEGGNQVYGIGTVKSGDRLSVEFDKSTGVSFRRYKQNGVLLRSETATGSFPPDNALSGFAANSGVLIGDVYWQMYLCAPERFDPGSPGDSDETQVIAESAFVLIDRIWRDQELTAGIPGVYVAAAPMTADAWAEFQLWRDVGAGYAQLYSTATAAIIGTAATVLAGTEIGTETVDVDLQPGQSLASFTSGEVTAGAGYVYLGGEIFQYQSAAQQSTTPNRWRLSVPSNRGAKCTDAFKATHVIGEDFVFLDPANVIFLPLETAEIGQARNCKGITAGQTLASVSPLSFTFNAPNFQVTTPPDYNLSFDSARSEVLHDWMPVDDPCLVTLGLIYEIYEDSAGAPGALLWSGNISEWREPVSGTGTHTYHFRAKTNYTAGTYLVRSITITSGVDGGLFGEPLFGE